VALSPQLAVNLGLHCHLAPFLSQDEVSPTQHWPESADVPALVLFASLHRVLMWKSLSCRVFQDPSRLSTRPSWLSCG
jgi:hypothetical protein